MLDVGIIYVNFKAKKKEKRLCVLGLTLGCLSRAFLGLREAAFRSIQRGIPFSPKRLPVPPKPPRLPFSRPEGSRASRT